MGNIWIVGPCSIESEKLYLETADFLYKEMSGRNWVYKASFDKANRTAMTGKRGPGMNAGLNLFKKVKDKYPDIKLTTDVHETWQIEGLVGLVDVIQIPAFLCRQTDLLVECGKHFNVVNIKKGQWINPDSTKHFVGKVRKENPDAEVWITERGTSFGYGQLIVDFGAVSEMKKHYDRVILDCTHSTQRKKGDFTGGDRELAERYVISAPLFDYDGVFAECHPNPPCAISDGDCQIFLNRIPHLLECHDETSKVIDDFKEC